MITITFTCTRCGALSSEKNPVTVGMPDGWRFDAGMAELLCPSCATRTPAAPLHLRKIQIPVPPGAE